MQRLRLTIKMMNELEIFYARLRYAAMKIEHIRLRVVVPLRLLIIEHNHFLEAMRFVAFKNCVFFLKLASAF